MKNSPNYKESKEKALNLLNKLGILTPAVDPIKICKELDINVYFAEFPGKDNEVVSGFFSGETNEIYVNKNEYPRRQTFTIAHELGHKILHEDWLNSADYKVLLRSSIDDGDPKEKEANCFAAHLLVPKYMLDEYYKIASVEELSRLFIVSEPVIRNRLKLEYNI